MNKTKNKKFQNPKKVFMQVIESLTLMTWYRSRRFSDDKAHQAYC